MSARPQEYIERDLNNFVFSCVGMRYKNHPLPANQLKTGMNIKLYPQSDNIHDEDAVAVLVDDKIFGQVSSDSCLVVREWLKKFKNYSIKILKHFSGTIEMKFVKEDNETEIDFID